MIYFNKLVVGDFFNYGGVKELCMVIKQKVCQKSCQERRLMEWQFDGERKSRREIEE